MPAELRLRDTTVGSVRLALALLRPWFREAVLQESSKATPTLCKLSYVLAQWPGQWWIRDHSEMWDIIRATAQVLVEEMLEHDKLFLEDSRLRGIIGDLEPVVRQFGVHGSCMDCVFPRPRTLSLSASSTTGSESSRSIHTLVEVTDAPEVDGKQVVKVLEHHKVGTQTPAASPLPSKVSKIGVHTSPTPSLSLPDDTTTETLTESSTESTPEAEESIEKASSPSAPKEPALAEIAVPSLSVTDVRPHSMVETATCVVTGVLFGAFIALCILSSQRRVLAMHLY